MVLSCICLMPSEFWSTSCCWLLPRSDWSDVYVSINVFSHTFLCWIKVIFWGSWLKGIWNNLTLEKYSNKFNTLNKALTSKLWWSIKIKHSQTIMIIKGQLDNQHSLPPHCKSTNLHKPTQSPTNTLFHPTTHKPTIDRH